MGSNISFSKSELTEGIVNYRKQLYTSFIAPIDGMWEALYIANATSYLITSEGEEIGYCCIDNEKSLNQLFLKESHCYLMSSVIGGLIQSGFIVSAHLSSIEPILFNSCLLFSKSIETNTINYAFSSVQEIKLSTDELNLRKAIVDDHDRIKSFFKAEIGFDDSFGYTENLINRGEIYVLEEGAEIIATGECRLSDSQPEYADVGMVVKQHNRKRGLGTRVLSELVKITDENNRKPICSTTVANVASQKAIERAGFYSSHIVFKMNF